MPTWTAYRHGVEYNRQVGDAPAALAGSDVRRAPRDVSATRGPGGPPALGKRGEMDGGGREEKTMNALPDSSVRRT
ncbi:hypothetical protein RHS03_07118, partial [Rhizoctonia solani]